MDKLTPQDKITKAIVRLQKHEPFFSYLVMHLKFEPNELTRTMAVDCYGNAPYNEEFVDSLSIEETEGVIKHEALHVGLCHLLRLGKRNKELFNVAADLVINDILISSGTRLPACGLIPKGHEYTVRGDGKDLTIQGLDMKSAEEVYNELRKAGIKPMETGFDEHVYIAKAKENDVPGIESECKVMMVEARNYAIGRGAGVGGIERIIEKLLPAKFDWRKLIHAAITSVIPTDFTYSRPSRKSIACGVYLPSTVRDTRDVIVSVDTSGSVDEETLKAFVGEVVGLGRCYRGMSMTMLIHDRQIQDVIALDGYESFKLANMKLKGGGGTSHKPVWEWIRKHKPSARLVVCLTDGATEFGNAPPCQVLWVLNADGVHEGEIPFGRTIRIPREG